MLHILKLFPFHMVSDNYKQCVLSQSETSWKSLLGHVGSLDVSKRLGERLAIQFLYLSMPMGMVQIFVILQNYR